MSAPRPTLSSALCYRDPKAALKWLEAAFGFETVMVMTDAEGNLGHSEMRFGDGIIMVGNEWTADHKSPASIAGKNTQTPLDRGHRQPLRAKRRRRAPSSCRTPRRSSTATGPIARAIPKGTAGPSRRR